MVDSVYVEEGDRVNTGDGPCPLEDRLQRAQYDLAISKHAEARARVTEVEADLAAVRRRMVRVEALAEKQLASVAELDVVASETEAVTARLARVKALAATARQQVEVQRVVLEDYVIRAPFGGIITERSAQPGEIVSPMSAGAALLARALPR